VKNEGNEENNSCDPDTCTVKHTVKKLSVLVEGFSTEVHEKVAAKVTCEEANKDEASDGHYEFFTDGGTPKTA